MSIKILNQSQAEAVYSAMCHLNNVGGQISAQIKTRDATVTVADYGTHAGVKISSLCRNGLEHEWHDNQAAFATAYGLQQG